MRLPVLSALRQYRRIGGRRPEVSLEPPCSGNAAAGVGGVNDIAFERPGATPQPEQIADTPARRTDPDLSGGELGGGGDLSPAADRGHAICTRIFDAGRAGLSARPGVHPGKAVSQPSRIAVRAFRGSCRRRVVAVSSLAALSCFPAGIGLDRARAEHRRRSAGQNARRRRDRRPGRRSGR